MIPYNSKIKEAAVIIKKNGGITPEKLLENMEGSEYISVDLNEAETKVIVELDETKLDTEVTEGSDNLITSGGVYDAIADIDVPEGFDILEITASGAGTVIPDDIYAKISDHAIRCILYANKGVSSEEEVFYYSNENSTSWFYRGRRIKGMAGDTYVSYIEVSKSSKKAWLLDNTLVSNTYSSTSIYGMNGVAVASAISNINFPVSSVNTKTGAVVLSASDILATNTQSVQANLERIDTEVEEVIDDLEGKLDASKSAVATVGGLVVPTASRTEDVLVGVSTDNDQMNITIGDGLTLVNNELSATGGATYTAGAGIDITTNVISVDNTIALKSEIPDVSDFATETYVDNAVDTKSTVSVSATGTATDEIKYITVDGVEKKIAGGGSGGSYTFTNGLTESSGTVGLNSDLFYVANNAGTKFSSGYYGYSFTNSKEGAISSLRPVGGMDITGDSSNTTMFLHTSDYHTYSGGGLTINCNRNSKNINIAWNTNIPGTVEKNLGTTSKKWTNIYGENLSDGSTTKAMTDILRGANIPAAPTSDGNYVLKCSIADGVASYSWVAE